MNNDQDWVGRIALLAIPFLIFVSIYSSINDLSA